MLVPVSGCRCGWYAAPMAPENKCEEAGCLECQWQREQLPNEIRELVLDVQKLHNEKCWFVVNCQQTTETVRRRYDIIRQWGE